MDCDDQQHTETARLAIGDHFAAMKKDLSQVQALLDEAVSGLLADTLAISAACIEQQAALAQGGQKAQGSLIALNRTIGERAKASITHLQFQDMVSQLIDHAKTRLDTVESLGLIVCAPEVQQRGSRNTHSDEISAEQTIGGSAHALARSARVMNSKPVLSVDMRAGDIEMF